MVGTPGYVSKLPKDQIAATGMSYCSLSLVVHRVFELAGIGALLCVDNQSTHMLMEYTTVGSSVLGAKTSRQFHLKLSSPQLRAPLKPTSTKLNSDNVCPALKKGREAPEASITSNSATIVGRGKPRPALLNANVYVLTPAVTMYLSPLAAIVYSDAPHDASMREWEKYASTL